MNRRIILTAAVILYAVVGAAALFLFRQMEMSPVVAGDTKDISLSSPMYVREAAPEESEVPESEPIPAEAETSGTASETESGELVPLYTYEAVHSEGRLFIREEADITSPILGSLSPGDTGNVLDLGDKWALVEAGDITGYVSKDFLELTPVE